MGKIIIIIRYTSYLFNRIIYYYHYYYIGPAIKPSLDITNGVSFIFPASPGSMLKVYVRELQGIGKNILIASNLVIEGIIIIIIIIIYLYIYILLLLLQY